MALRPGTRYSTQTISTDPAYPWGKARNVSDPGDGSGTPFEADLVNDIFGMQQALLGAARITPSGTPDSASSSQYLQALLTLIQHRGRASLALANATRTLHVASGSYRHLHDVCFGHGAGQNDYGVYLAVGIGALIPATPRYALSFDGENWENLAAASGSIWHGCAHGGPGAFGSRLFVLVGMDQNNRCKIFSAPDSLAGDVLTLTERTPSPQPQAASHRVRWTGQAWVIVGEYNATRNAQILTTPDLTAFTAQTPAGGYVGYFKRIHVVQASPYTGNVVIGGTGGELQLSTNHGDSWARVYSNAAVGEITAIIEIEGVLLAGTNLGSTVLRSTDGGQTWAAVATIPSTPMQGFTTDKQEVLGTVAGVVVAVLKAAGSEKRVLVLSYDRGLTWTHVLRMPGTTLNQVHNAAASDGQRLVFVGGDSTLQASGFAAASLRIPG